MIVRQVDSFESLESLRDRWDELARGCPFRQWNWLNTWWRHYGKKRELRVFSVISDAASSAPSAESLVALLPCYLEQNFTQGRVLRLLGDGEVCTEYIDLMAEPQWQERAVVALADHLAEHNVDWQLAGFTSIGPRQTGLHALTEALALRGCQVNRLPNENSWRIPLPKSWEEFLALQSKSHRKQLRRLERRIEHEQSLVWHEVNSPSGLEEAWPILVELHQRRRQSLGEPGCFASTAWSDFHRDLVPQLLDSGQLRVSWLERLGEPIAAEYHFADADSTYAYQGGVAPKLLDEEPGKLSMILTLQRAIREGHRYFDLLRGDEPYKAHWRAEPTATDDVYIVPARQTAQWRYQAWSFARRLRRATRATPTD